MAAGGDDGFSWSMLLGHIRHQRLVPIVGPDVCVVDIGGGAEQTLTTLIGQRLVEQFGLRVSPGPTTMDDAVVALLREDRERVGIELYQAIDDIVADLDPVPGTALRDLAAIEDLTLFVSTTPDRLLARALDAVRFQGRGLVREISFSPSASSESQVVNARAGEPTDTVVFSLFGQTAPMQSYAIHDEDKLEFLHKLISQAVVIPNWLKDALTRRPMLFIGCEIRDWMGRFLLRLQSDTRLSEGSKQFFIVHSPSDVDPSLSGFFDTYFHKSRFQELQMEPTAFVAELRARWEQLSAGRPRAAAPVAARAPSAAAPGAPTIFISYLREDLAAARRLADAVNGISGNAVWFDERRLRAGAEWESEIMEAIGKTVRLFIPVISANTEKVDEGYVYREWREAVERSKSILGRRFIVPVIIDEGYQGDAGGYRRLPPEFRGLQFGQAPDGNPDAALMALLEEEIRNMRRSGEAA